ncbi:hypothetical protein EW146_g4084 [Bondarzewia mesenterica]|uniref:Uncharacterized protein n=1 Tax=Bondarzewia mesenterica TaxID=1095465 RepID=A0A4S4LVM1_9AGAM|nr:hypothetical protein EW146_g4084 [Bondarzewia mesenterica]
MSLARAALAAARPKPLSTTVLQRRLASSSSHEEHHIEEHHADSAEYYPKEGRFHSRGWTYAILAALAAAAFYKYAPAPGEDNYITRYIQHYTSPKDLWATLNNKHLDQSQIASEARLLTESARRAPIHRYRFPQSFESASPYLIPVGTNIDVAGLEVKGDKGL